MEPSQKRSILRNPRSLYIGVIVVAVIVLWALISFVSSAWAWKAVFLDNNQVYFGKFISVPFSHTITLKHVYFIKSDQSASASSSMVIAPLSSSIHDPRNTMYVSKDHILFYEELNPNSPLVKGILLQEKGTPSL